LDRPKFKVVCTRAPLGSDHVGYPGGLSFFCIWGSAEVVVLLPCVTTPRVLSFWCYCSDKCFRIIWYSGLHLPKCLQGTPSSPHDHPPGYSSHLNPHMERCYGLQPGEIRSIRTQSLDFLKTYTLDWCNLFSLPRATYLERHSYARVRHYFFNFA
jgi:hypothetical protein